MFTYEYTAVFARDPVRRRTGVDGVHRYCTYLLRVRVYPAQGYELVGEHVVENLRLVRCLHRVRRTLTK